MIMDSTSLEGNGNSKGNQSCKSKSRQNTPEQISSRKTQNNAKPREVSNNTNVNEDPVSKINIPLQKARLPTNPWRLPNGQNVSSVHQPNSERRGLIVLKQSFKDCTTSLPPPSSDTNIWPSLSGDSTKNGPGGGATPSAYANSPRHATFKERPTNVWDRRMHTRSQENQMPSLGSPGLKKMSTQKNKKEAKVIDWFENDCSVDNSIVMQETKDKKPLNSKSCKEDIKEKLLPKKNSFEPHGSPTDTQDTKNSASTPTNTNEMENCGWRTVKRKPDKNQRRKANETFNNNDKLPNLSKIKSKPLFSSEHKQAKPDKSVLPDVTIKKEPADGEESEKRRNRKIKKSQLKEKKKFEREEQVKLQRALAKRDTRVQIISAMDVSASAGTSKNSNYPSAMNDQYQEEDPSRTSDQGGIPFSKDFPSILPMKDFPPILSTSRSNHANSSKPAWPRAKPKDPTSFKGMPAHKPQEAEKKQVRTRDPITFDLLAAVKKPEQKRPKTVRSLGHQITKEKAPPRKGKVRENAKKKLTVLKKNMLAERRARRERLLDFFEEQIIEYKKSLQASVEQPQEDAKNIPNEERTEGLNPSSLVELKNAHKDPIVNSQTSSPPAKLGAKPATCGDETAAILKTPDSPAPNAQKGDVNLVNGQLSGSSKPEAKNVSNEIPHSVPQTVNEQNGGKKQISKWDQPEYLSQISESRVEKYKDMDLWHPTILGELEKLSDPIHGSKFREYCDHLLTPEIDVALEEFLRAVVTLQSNHYKRDPIKAKIRQRYYCGLKETYKHMNHMSCIVIAPDIKRSPGQGSLDELVLKVVNQAKLSEVPLVFGLTLHSLRKITFRKSYVSCVGIVNYEGAQEKFATLSELVTEARNQYMNLFLKKLPS